MAEQSLWRTALIAVPAIVALGLIMGWISNSGFGNPWYDPLDKPDFQPPGWAFGVIWTALYAMMGFALAAILTAPRSMLRSRALGLFIVQLLLNFAWSPIFFGGGMIDVGLIIIVIMAALVAATILAFWKIRPLAGALLVPYLAWLCLAVALNYETGRLNPGADKAPLGITGA